MELSFEYEHGKYIEFTAHDINYFIGSNHDVKWKLFRGLKRFSKGKNLSELEEHVYGDDGIVILKDGKQLKAKDLSMYCLDSRESFLQEYQMSKGNLMYEHIYSYEQNFSIVREIEKMNDAFLRLENTYQQELQKVISNAIPYFQPLTHADLVKNFLSFHYYEEQTLFPVEMMDISYLIDDYCRLLEEEIMRTGKESWVILNNPSTFLSGNYLNAFLGKLSKLANETKNLSIFIISDNFLDIEYSFEDIEKTILLYQDCQQLPEYAILKQSIERGYPEEFSRFDDELVISLFRIFQYIGQFDRRLYLKPKDMVLLKVVNELLDCQFDEDTNFVGMENEELTAIEKLFLESL